MLLLIVHKLFSIYTGDMEFKQNKFLPADKQIVTANPDINTVCTVSVMKYLAKFHFWDFTVRLCFPFLKPCNFVFILLRTDS